MFPKRKISIILLLLTISTATFTFGADSLESRLRDPQLMTIKADTLKLFNTLANDIDSYLENHRNEGQSRNIRIAYGKLLFRAGNYYYDNKQFEQALIHYQKALDVSVYKNQNYRNKIAHCRTQLIIKKIKGVDTPLTTHRETNGNKTGDSRINLEVIVLFSVPLLLVVGFVIRNKIRKPLHTHSPAKTGIINDTEQTQDSYSSTPPPTATETGKPRRERPRQETPVTDINDLRQRIEKPVSPPAEPETENDYPERLWGILDPQDETMEKIDLSNEPSYFELIPPKDLPPVTMKSEIINGKKVIKLDFNEGDVLVLDENKNDTNKKYIDESAHFLKILIPNEKEKSHEYKYTSFKNLIEDDYHKPVDKAEHFVGRNVAKLKVEENFLKENETYDDLLISGMGNSGKTSLMRHLHRDYFRNHDILKHKFISLLFEYDKNKHTDSDFSIFKNLVNNKLKELKKEPKTKIILIDEYDKLMEHFQVEFTKFIWKCKEMDHIFIFSGQRGLSWIKTLKQKNKRILPRHITPITLYGLDHNQAALQADTDYKNSRKLIENILTSIGFPSHYISTRAKDYLAMISSGFPSLIKIVIKVLVSKWIDTYTLRPIIDEHVHDCVFLDIISEEEKRIFARAYDYDKEINITENQEKRKLKSKETEPEIQNNGEPVTVDAILAFLKSTCDEYGRVNAAIFREKFAKFPNAIDEDKIKTRMNTLNIKIEQLKDNGFLIEKDSYLIGVPRMFFMGGKRSVAG